MKLSFELLQKLKCSNCECYLSRIPISVQENGAAICGRCKIPENKKAFRMLQYENLLPLLSFSCMYRNDGCRETIPYAKLRAHEDECNYKYKKYVCPIMPSGTCDWIDSHQQLYEHCNDKHSHRIINHPCILKHNLDKNSYESYVTHHAGHLFVIHAKVCLDKYKISHSVHYVGDISDLAELNYRIDIRRDGETIVKKGVIEPLGVTQESSSVVCGINGIKEILHCLDGITFTIYILIKNKSGLKCEICNVNDKQYFGKYCAECAEKRRPCYNEQKGCPYIDIPIKTDKHEERFCLYENSWIDYEFVHEDKTFTANEYWKINFDDILNNPDNDEFNFIIVTSQFDNCFGTIKKIDLSKIAINLSSKQLTEEARKYMCIVKIKAKTGSKIKLVVPFTLDSKEDWSTSLCITSDLNGLLADLKEILISFDIRKKDY